MLLVIPLVYFFVDIYTSLFKNILSGRTTYTINIGKSDFEGKFSHFLEIYFVAGLFLRIAAHPYWSEFVKGFCLQPIALPAYVNSKHRLNFVPNFCNPVCFNFIHER